METITEQTITGHTPRAGRRRARLSAGLLVMAVAIAGIWAGIVATAHAVPPAGPNGLTRLNPDSPGPGLWNDPIALYGPRILFDITRDGDPVGQHDVRFEAGPDGRIQVAVAFEVAIRWLGFTVYRYHYRSTATWRDGRLLTLTAEQNDDGARSRVRAETQDRSLVVDGPRGRWSDKGAIFPTNHWHAGVLSQDMVLNTLSGARAMVEIRHDGRDIVDTAGGSVAAWRFTYSGDFESTVWYDDAGRWVKMRFAAKDGSVIDYRCVVCRPGDQGEGEAREQ